MKRKILALPLLGLTLITLGSCSFLNGGSKTTTTQTEQSSSSTSVSNTTTTPTTSQASTTASQNGSSSTNTNTSTSTSTATTTSTRTTTTTTTTTSIPTTTTSSTTRTSTSTATATTTTSTTTKTSTSTSTSTNTSTPEDNHGINITEVAGYGEAAYAKFVAQSGQQYNAYYKKSTDSNYTQIDSELVRVNGDSGRVDVLGLSSGTYTIKIEKKNATSTYTISSSFNVMKQDRLGYAHHNYTSGVGAYNDDGTLKSGAKVLYVTNENKNTITYNGKTGLVAILQNQKNSSTPLDIRIIGSIKTNQYKYKSDAPRLIDNSNLQEDTFFDNELETTYGDNLVGLTVQYMDKYSQTSYKFLSTASGLKSNGTGSSSKKTTTYKGTDYSDITGQKVYDDDSYFNMLDVQDASNVTIEGVGVDAEIFQWGFTWKKCKSIEVKNVTFTDYPEDACSFEGSDNTKSSLDTYTNFWIHNSTFNKGKNNWDISGERDKYAGDGGMDLKYVSNVTSSYNQFYKCKKTGLVGGSNSDYTKNITFHHNYYNNVGSRLPLGRQANMHFYNNYYYKCSTCQDIRSSAFVLSESNYFYNCSNPQLVTDDTDNGYLNTVIKSYNDVLVSCGTSKATVVTSRTQSLTGACMPDGVTNYSNFDTNSSLFYYDSTKQCSKVTIMNTAEETKNLVPIYAGAGVLKTPEANVDNTPTEPQEDVTHTTSIPTSAGLYGRVLEYDLNTSTNKPDTSTERDANYSSTNIVEKEKNTIIITDTADLKTTYAYYIFENSYTTGEVTYTITLQTTGIGSKWSLVQFLDGDKNIAVRCSTKTNNKNYWSYSIDGSNEILFENVEFKANTSYTIVLTINYNSSSINLSVNGTTLNITGYTPKAISGIQFMTAIAATDRSFTVSEISVV